MLLSTEPRAAHHKKANAAVLLSQFELTLNKAVLALSANEKQKRGFVFLTKLKAMLSILLTHPRARPMVNAEAGF